MKRKEKEQFWLEKINEYRESGMSLVQWCKDTDVAIHNMNYKNLVPGIEINQIIHYN